jgi:tRNA dimethylallyltransferase
MQPDGENPSQPSPLVVLLGATAVGKTALSLSLATALNGEIVSADSRLVYTGMDIGVAKPTPVERIQVPHHLLDLVRPDQTLSLAVYQALAYAAIDDILERGKRPFLVGGTGQYISAVIEGWRIPEVKPDFALRQELERFAAEHGPQALHDRLRQHDTAAAEAIHPNNVRRVVRALEVCLVSGIPISVLQRKVPPPYRILQVGLTRPREDLQRRIDLRIDQMLQAGLIEEVRGLLDAGYARRLPAMTGLGYAQLSAYLAGETSLEDAIQAIRRETRDFARRQEVWFRKYNRDARWFDMTIDDPEAILRFIGHWLESESHATS